MTRALVLISSNDVVAGLERIKAFGASQSETIGPKSKSGPFGPFTSQINDSGQVMQNIKIEPQHNPTQQQEQIPTDIGHQGKEVTLTDFDNMGSPRKGKRAAVQTTGKSPRAAKKPKVDITENVVENKLLLAEIKRKAIKDCDLALKVVRPNSDKERVIYNDVLKLGRKMVFGPERPFIFYKLVCNLIPEINDLPESKKIPQLLVRLASFIAQNIAWTQV